MNTDNICGNEAEYWRKKYEDCKVELDEFQESSRELEQELEAQLDQWEKLNKELQANVNRYQAENESLKAKLNRIKNETSRQILDLQKDLNTYQADNERLARYIRELEQSNDDLERAKRALLASLEDFESRYNHQIEKNVLLENELGEKEELEVIVQRLKDQTRDLQSELTVREQNQSKYEQIKLNRRLSLLEETNVANNINNNISNNNINNNNNISNNNNINNNNIIKTMIGEKNSCSPVKSLSIPNPNSPISPPTRISSLNIVSDLLRKVGALESKLDSCRYPSGISTLRKKT